jgi:hypothetical protein
MQWTVAAPDSIAVPTVSATLLPVGTAMLGAHLRDTEIPAQSLRDLGYLELQTTNNRRPAFGSAGGTQP